MFREILVTICLQNVFSVRKTITPNISNIKYFKRTMEVLKIPFLLWKNIGLPVDNFTHGQ